MCSKSGHLHLIVPASRFQLLQGEMHLSTYTFNTHTAKHLFCKICGIKPFYVPRSHPDGFSVNARCLDDATISSVTVRHTNGKEWEKQYPRGRGDYE
ncbi:GFA family protein [Alteromonas sp. chi3]|uniref:GFA family protein n=1 Tax=Alteromonas gilva TaxID=2987522 RepID=A0ABT5L3L0_9ALTE|nr:GFA family protein [Alteromonas gilva]MDC8831635.1 GFA family protein [Alteromonas gilva]